MTGREEAATQTADPCSQCGQPLAHDQRYCVVCGTRRAALPPMIANALRDLGDPPAATPAPAAGVPGPIAGAPDRLRELLPLARAVAVSILLMLGVGSVLGAATTPGGVTSLASTIVVALSPTAAPAPRTIAAVTTPRSTGAVASAPAASGGGGGGDGGGAGSAVTPTTQAQRTVTISASSSASPPATSATPTTPTPSPTTALPPIHHVWEIVLSDQGYAQSFGDARADPYLAGTLAQQGTLISDYDAVAGSPLANEIALVSGQGPTAQTLADCPQYTDITPGQTGRHGQTRGEGCLYPASAATLGSELQIQGLKWRAYIQGVGTSAQTSPPTTSSTTTTSTSTSTLTSTSTSTSSLTSTAPDTSTSGSTSGTATATVPDTSTADACPHPAEGAADPADQVRGGDDYVTWKNPFVYFHSLLDSTTCPQSDVGLGALATDLRTANTTPAFSYIAPDPCDDGSSVPCRPTAKAGLRQADRFLESVVPEIEHSAAYRDDGLILITFDDAPQTGPQGSTASCCGEPTFPNLPEPSTNSSTSTTGTSSSTSTSPTSSGSTTPVTGVTSAAPTTSTSSSTTAACTSTPTTATTPAPTTASTTATTTDCAPAITGDPPGGGQVGMLMISPYVTADKVDVIDEYNHFSALKSVADLLGVTPPGYAAETGVTAFNSALFLTTKR